MKSTKPILCFLVIFWLSNVLAVSAASKPMNVLFLAVDDLNTWLLGDTNRYTGQVVAPTITKLASEGVLFVRSYCAAPKCSPSRTSLLSGVAPWKSGIYQNAQRIEESSALHAAIPLPQLFKDHGYYTASAGKISHGYSMKGAWDEEIPHARDPIPPGKKPGGWGAYHLPESEMGDTKYADFAIRELQKDHDKPFFIACGIFHPHSPWYVPQKYLDLYPFDEIIRPETIEDDLADVPAEGVRLSDPDEHESVMKRGVAKEVIQAYLASTSYADAQIGRVLEALEASPYKDNTLIVLWSDHGYHKGEKNHWGKGTLWEEGTHNLLMFKVPNVTKPKQVCERFVSLQDIYPTLVDLCGLPAPEYLDGNSLVPLLKDPALSWDKPVITGYTEKWESDVFLSVRTEDYRYIRYREGSEEFYYCRKDPHEWTNQIDNPEFQTEIDRHRAMLPTPAEAVPYSKNGKK